MYAIGQDDADPPNLMKEAKKVASRTLDNLPPQFVMVDVVNIQGTTATLVAQINEPSNVTYAVFEGIGGTCPSAEKVHLCARKSHHKESKHLDVNFRKRFYRFMHL